MDEIIVRVGRALACMPRLQILSKLAAVREAMPSALARDLRMGRDSVCMHIRRLSDAGLVRRRRSGARCYCIARSPYRQEALSGRMSRWLGELLRNPARTLRNCRVDQLRNSSFRDDEQRLHQLLFEALTAFTNLRRLQILRHLAGGRALTVDRLTSALHMSSAAVSRHMEKLVRRGYVDVARQGVYLAYRLSTEYKSGVHKALYRIVASSMVKKELRS